MLKVITLYKNNEFNMMYNMMLIYN